MHKLQIGDLVSHEFEATVDLGIIIELRVSHPGGPHAFVLWNRMTSPLWAFTSNHVPVQPDEDSGIVFKLVGNTSSNQINTLEKTE